MKFVEKHIFLIMISIVFITSMLVFFVIEAKYSPNLLNIDRLILDKTIQYEMDVVEDNGAWVIKGYAFHPDNFEEYMNYISGSGTAYWVDTLVVLQSKDDVYALYTSPLYRSDVIVEGVDLGKSGFYSTVKENQLPKGKLRLGLLVKVDDVSNIIWSAKVIDNE